jgi:hypothetical protein
VYRQGSSDQQSIRSQYLIAQIAREIAAVVGVDNVNTDAALLHEQSADWSSGFPDISNIKTFRSQPRTFMSGRVARAKSLKFYASHLSTKSQVISSRRWNLVPRAELLQFMAALQLICAA